MRRIADLAKMMMSGGAVSVCAQAFRWCILPGEGVVPSLVSVAAMTILTSWWYSRKIEVQQPSHILQVWQGRPPS